MEFLAIPILINGNVQYFDFKYSDLETKGNFCSITSLSKKTILDTDHKVVISDMPVEWQKASIKKLEEILASSDFNP